VYAQGTQQSDNAEIDLANLFTWATSNPPNWGLGGLYAALGLVGALFTVFGLVGSAVPGTAGKAKIDADTERLKRLTERFEELATVNPPDSAAITAVGDQVDKIRDDLRNDTLSQFAIASILYVVLGAFFAMMLAQDILQAILMGAGWTAAVGTLGLKKDFEKRKEVKDDVAEKLLSRAEELERKLKEADKWDDKAFEDFEALERDVKVAKAL
jgi:hypothetical protein